MQLTSFEQLLCFKAAIQSFGWQRSHVESLLAREGRGDAVASQQLGVFQRSMAVLERAMSEQKRSLRGRSIERKTMAALAKRPAISRAASLRSELKTALRKVEASPLCRALAGCKADKGYVESIIKNKSVLTQHEALIVYTHSKHSSCVPVTHVDISNRYAAQDEALNRMAVVYCKKLGYSVK